MKRTLAINILLFFTVLLLQLNVNAQNNSGNVVVQGKILDQDRKPVADVTVAEIDKEQRIIRAVKTDVEGNFALRISNTADSLTFSYIGNGS